MIFHLKYSSLSKENLIYMASKHRKNKAKFKWTKELIILIVALVAILTVTIVLSVPSEKSKSTKRWNAAITAVNSANTSTDSNASSYSLLPNENVFEEISHNRLMKKIDSGDYVYVIYGSTNNNVLLSQLYNINIKASDEEIKTIYIYSSLWVEETEDKETEAFKEKTNTLESEINENKEKDVEEFSLLSYPAMLVFHEGKLIFNSQGYDDVDQYNWYMYVQKALLISKNNE